MQQKKKKKKKKRREREREREREKASLVFSWLIVSWHSSGWLHETNEN
jgi:hypothetical protein